MRIFSSSLHFPPAFFFPSYKSGCANTFDHLRFVVRDKGEEICSDNLQFEEFVDLYNFIFNREQDEEENESEDLMEAFKIFDENNDGYISCEELQRVLSALGLIPHTQPPQECEKMISNQSLHNLLRLLSIKI
ncbi:hypothetical protein SUGI_0210230 [Cryptomeria japonica]|nr:hypothetical protein SUGI_0210230 [Cryptomeria japonica]